MPALAAKDANRVSKPRTNTKSKAKPKGSATSKAREDAVQKMIDEAEAENEENQPPSPDNAPSKTNDDDTNNKASNNPLDEVSDLDEDDEIIIEWNCNQVRSKITTFINNTGTKLGEFQTKLGISADSYRTFMRQSGASAGMGSDAYLAAHQFFAKREAKGLKMPRAKKSTSTSTSASKSKSATKTKDNGDEDKKKSDISDTHLDGEKQGKVPVYDTCNDIRTKIEAYQRKNNVTAAAFARLISPCQDEHETAVQGAQVTAFLRKGKKTPMAGNTSKAFYASYVFFEKLRIKEKRNKTKKRQEMEAEYGAEGVDLVNVAGNARMWCRGDERPYVDNLGRMQIGYTR